MCNVFVEHFDQLILDYSMYSSLVCICIFANPMKSFTHGRRGEGKEKEKKKEKGGGQDMLYTKAQE